MFSFSLCHYHLAPGGNQLPSPGTQLQALSVLPAAVSWAPRAQPCPQQVRSVHLLHPWHPPFAWIRILFVGLNYKSQVTKWPQSWSKEDTGFLPFLTFPLYPKNQEVVVDKGEFVTAERKTCLMAGVSCCLTLYILIEQLFPEGPLLWTFGLVLFFLSLIPNGL